MLYNDVLKVLSTSDGRCYLDDWLIACKIMTITKIVAFNLFCDIHYENIPQANLISNLEALENHLRNIKNPGLHPLAKIQRFFAGDFPYLRGSHQTPLDEINKLSRMTDTSTIERLINNRQPDFFKKRPSDSKSIDLLMSKLEKYIMDEEKKGRKVIFGNLSKIAWFGPTKKLDIIRMNRTESESLANDFRDILGLPAEDLFLVEIQFEPNSIMKGYLPSTFHSDFFFLFMPQSFTNGWGMTQNWNDLRPGIEESVLVDSKWPKYRYIKLGTCSKHRVMNSRDIDQCLNFRIEYFKKWAGGNTKIISELYALLTRWS